MSAVATKKKPPAKRKARKSKAAKAKPPKLTLVASRHRHDTHVPTIVKMRMEGKTWTAIAAKLGCTRDTVEKLRKRHGIDEAIARQVMDSAERVTAKFANSAAKVSDQVLDIAAHGDKEDATRLVASKYILDRVMKAAEGPALLPPAGGEGEEPESFVEMSNEELAALAGGDD